jgi:hypothetical protein
MVVEDWECKMKLHVTSLLGLVRKNGTHPGFIHSGLKGATAALEWHTLLCSQ